MRYTNPTDTPSSSVSTWVSTLKWGQSATVHDVARAVGLTANAAYRELSRYVAVGSLVTDIHGYYALPPLDQLRTLTPGTRVNIHGNIRTLLKVEEKKNGGLCLHLNAPMARSTRAIYMVYESNASEVDVVPTADIRVLRTAFKFDIVENSSGNIIARDVEDDRPVRWFIPADGDDPVPCPVSMQQAVAALTARHCEVPGHNRLGQRVLITYTNPFEYEV